MTDTLVPNYTDADEAGMAALDTQHLKIITDGLRGHGIVSGGAVTHDTGLDLDVAAAVIADGTDQVDVDPGSVSITTGVGLTAGFARRDVIVADVADGALSVVDGTAAAYDPENDLFPVLPTIPSDKVAFATHFIKAGESAASANRLTLMPTTAAIAGTVLGLPELAAADPTEIEISTAGGVTTLGIGPGIARSTVQVSGESGTTFTPTADDAPGMVSITNPDPITVTLPDGVFSLGDSITFHQMGVGKISFTAGAGAAIIQEGGYAARTRAQYSVVQAILIDDDFLGGGTDVWLLVGALDAA
jgi:DNA-binding transcriptional regulator YdaS (Cro superfamily)